MEKNPDDFAANYPLERSHHISTSDGWHRKNMQFQKKLKLMRNPHENQSITSWNHDRNNIVSINNHDIR